MPRQTIQTQATLRRSAILLTTLGETRRKQILAGLPPLQRAQLRRAIDDLVDVDPLERQQTLRAFLSSAHNLVGKSPARKTEAPPNPETDFEAPSPAASRPSPFAFLGSVPDDVLFRAVENEHPQTIAIVLASLKPAQSARLLAGLQESLRIAAVQRLANLREMPDDAVASISEHLQQLVAQAAPSTSQHPGSQSLQAILAEVPGDIRRDVHATLGWEPPPPEPAPEQASPAPTRPPEPGPPDTAVDGPNAIPENPQLRFVAPEQSESAPLAKTANATTQYAAAERHVQATAPVELRDALATMASQQALLAVCGLPQGTSDAVLATLPRRQARQVRRQIEALESVHLSDIDEALCELARRTGWSPAVPLAAAA